MIGAGALVRGAAEIVAPGSGAAWRARRRRRGAAVVLAYHNIVPDGQAIAGDRSLHLSQHSFGAQLDALIRTHDVVPLAEILEPGCPARPRAAITFDDAYRGAVTAGVSEVVRRGLPATIFVAPAFLGGRSFWWDRIATDRTGALDPSFREDALDACAGRNDLVLARAERLGLPLTEPPSHARAASLEELSIASDSPGITLGSHSWSHPNLARLGGIELEDELRRPIAWLTERFGHVVPWLAYPYGLSSPATEHAVERAGYVAALRVSGGWIPPASELHRFALPRLNVPNGMSARGFRLRLSGLWAR